MLQYGAHLHPIKWHPAHATHYFKEVATSFQLHNTAPCKTSSSKQVWRHRSVRLNDLPGNHLKYRWQSVTGWFLHINQPNLSKSAKTIESTNTKQGRCDRNVEFLANGSYHNISFIPFYWDLNHLRLAVSITITINYQFVPFIKASRRWTLYTKTFFQKSRLWA